MGRMNLMSQLFGQVQDAITVASLAVGLLVYAPWLILLLALALVPAFIGESHFNALNYSLNFQWTPERRQLEYLRQMGASVETAKEVKIFNLNRFFIERFRTLSQKFFEANRKLAGRRALWGTLLAALGTLGYYMAYGYIAWRTVRGDFTIGDLVFLSGSFGQLNGNFQQILIGFTQIAGLVARRIVPFVKPGDFLAIGQRVGLIRFGSRVDVYLPAGTRPRVLSGQRTVAGETVIAEIGDGLERLGVGQ